MLELSAPDEAQLDDRLGRDGTRLERSERLVEVASALVVVLAAVALPLLFGIRDGHPVGSVVAAALVLACAMHVRFDISTGFTVPTQLGFVPLLLAAPGSLLPALTVGALVAGRLPEVVRGELRPTRLISTVPNCAFAVGPAVVVCLQQDDPLPLGVLLAAAFAAQASSDFLVSAWREGVVGGASLAEQAREAWAVVAIDLALTPAGAAVGVAGGLWPLALLPLLLVLAGFARERRSRLEGLSELNKAYRGTAVVLGDVIEADDGYTGAHSQGVVELALRAGRELGLDHAGLRDLEFGALLHDVGKVAIPKTIINKPGPLDDDEWAIMRTHTVLGQDMLDRVGGFMRGVGLIVRSHHERWDGGGYPDRLAGDAIPLAARIIACCDTYNAMTTDRPYRRALGVDVACAELRAEAGRQFDPQVVAATLRALEGERPGASVGAPTP